MTVVQPRRDIVLTGTFDVRNYGDLLFPLLAAQRLLPFGMIVQPASPTGRDTGWRNTMPSNDLRSAFSCEVRFDGVLIGGGNIIHSRPVTLPAYEQVGLGRCAYRDLWLGASLTALRARVPIAWNAPGVPYAFSEQERSAVQATLAAAGYVAVRDFESAKHLAPFHACVVPDTALDLAQLWSRRQLDEDFRLLLQRKCADANRRHVAIHIKQRSVAGEVEMIAPMLDSFCRTTNCVPILIALGQCHDDHSVTRQVVKALSIPAIDLSAPLGLREIAAAIANSAAYIGASMHGYITAAAYSVPGIIVGKPRLPKMQGLLAHLSREHDEVSDWQTAFGEMAARGCASCPTLPSHVFTGIDEHWKQVADALARPTRLKPNRMTLSAMSDAAGECSIDG